MNDQLFALPPRIWGFEDHGFLSNFASSRVEFEGMFFPTVEHGFVAAKTLDVSQREHIQTIATPGRVKRFGRKLVLRADWEEVKVDVMRQLVSAKFFTHENLGDLLIGTAPLPIFEANGWGDKVWGVDAVTGQGANLLGIILMEVRESLIAQRMLA